MNLQPLFSRILCPVDFSPASQPALAFAERLAASISAELLLLHACEVTTSDPLGEPGHAEATRQLQALPIGSSSIPVQRILHLGAPGEVICWIAENRQCDLIVMGTHGRGGLLHLLMGSVTEYVVRHARCPVVTIRLRPESEPPLAEPIAWPLPPPRFM